MIEEDLVKNYILKKTELEPSLDANESYTLQQFKGSDNKEYNIVFDTNPKIPTALVETDNFKNYYNKQKLELKEQNIVITK